MLHTKSNSSKQSNSHYQSLYLWASFLLGMISLGIVVWNRKSVIPVQMGSQVNSVIPHAMRNLLLSRNMEIPRVARDDAMRQLINRFLANFTAKLCAIIAYNTKTPICNHGRVGILPVINGRTNTTA